MTTWGRQSVPFKSCLIHSVNIKDYRTFFSCSCWLTSSDCRWAWCPASTPWNGRWWRRAAGWLPASCWWPWRWLEALWETPCPRSWCRGRCTLRVNKKKSFLKTGDKQNGRNSVCMHWWRWWRWFLMHRHKTVSISRALWLYLRGFDQRCCQTNKYTMKQNSVNKYLPWASSGTFWTVTIRMTTYKLNDLF